MGEKLRSSDDVMDCLYDNIDMDHTVTDGYNVLVSAVMSGIMVTSSATSISLATCSSIPTTLASSFKFPGSLASLM